MARESKRILSICRKITFSSAHRYYNPAWSEEENRQAYGSLFNEHGYGHNFRLEAWVEGNIDQESGMVMNLKQLDLILKEVVKPLDHHHLNLDVPYFQQVVPTTENIAVYCFQQLTRRLRGMPVQPRKVRLYEGEDLWVEYGTISES